MNVENSNNYSQNDVDRVIKHYDGKTKTLTTYSYYESSNQKWVKVLVTVKGVQDHPKDKINVVFGPRTLDVFVKDIGPSNDEIWHFGCRKLHRYIVPEESKWVIKKDTVQASLKKKKKGDNWWSLFKAKATGEKDSDLEDNKDEEEDDE